MRRSTAMGFALQLSVLGLPNLADAQAGVGHSTDRVWQVVTERPTSSGPTRADLPGQCAIVRLNKPALDALMRDAPREAGAGATNGVVVALPMPDGTFARFRAVESSMVAPELAAAFPGIRTYSGQGLDDPTATTRFGWTPAGFHAIVIGSEGSVYIDPYAPGDVEYYVSFRKAR